MSGDDRTGVLRHGRVIVTRPEPGLSRTAARLAALGYMPVLLPLGEIVPVAPLPPFPAHDAVIVTSGNAVPALAALPSGKPVHCVGTRTAMAVREAGHVAGVVGPDATALGAMLVGSAAPATTFLYPCAEARKPALEQCLGAAGHRVLAVPVYANRGVAVPPGGIRGDETALLLHAPSAARRVGGLGPLGDATRILCLSADVADALPTPLRQKAEVSDAPDEDQLFALLAKGR